MGIFNAQEAPGKMLMASARVTIAGEDAVLLDVQIQISRPLSAVPTLTNGVYWAAQPVQGTIQANSILTESKALVNKLTGAKCEGVPITIALEDGCAEQSTGYIDIPRAFCTQISFTLNAQQGYVGLGFAAQFSNAKLGPVS